ncbi:pimeloyl-ACP methyl ester carboxylesterase [Stackebrandtia albiflava]|uniref:Pimeloyl-ACP methyl ester carboxylesterase n=1 Tax=Stackebrandtia albiflava TaxID=406432 RepID=A0A562V188_9ACTN|nr:alpha/beta fold hydrolase [Stackebrandtia albiflava]TWJ11686.1 pimeloyl-ACP methyl ester carboxylesterase [Stackebrandtia albiflava]
MNVPVVFIPGIRVTGSMWRPQRDALGARRAVTAVDLPGHGVHRDREFTMAEAVRVVIDAVDRLDRGPALLAGASLGGYVAFAAAASRPERVAGVVAVGSTALVTPARIRPYRLMAALSGRTGDAVQRLLLRLALGTRAAADLTAGGLHTSVVPEVLAAMSRHDPLADLAAYPGPVWLANGTRDHFRVDENRFLAACRDGRSHPIPRAGHLAGLTRPGEVTRLIEAAAEEVSRRRPSPPR